MPRIVSTSIKSGAVAERKAVAALVKSTSQEQQDTQKIAAQPHTGEQLRRYSQYLLVTSSTNNGTIMYLRTLHMMSLMACTLQQAGLQAQKRKKNTHTLAAERSS